MTLALLFSGQGMQHPRMLPWLVQDHPLLLAMQQQLGIAHWREALADAQWASTNRHAQLLLTATGLAAWDQLSHALPIRLGIVAGYSVGELAACCVNGMFDANTALELAQQRAQLMDAAALGQDFGMLAVSGLPILHIDALCAQTGTALAIRNGPDNSVCAGPRAALDTLQQQATQQGAHCTPLAVRVPSHTHWLHNAAQGFEQVLTRHAIAAPQMPWPSNTGEWIWRADAAQLALARQIAHTIEWEGCMELVFERQPSAVLEIGPGQGLASMWSRRYPAIAARSADEFHSMAALLRWLSRHLE